MVRIEKEEFDNLKKDAENYRELKKLFFEKNFGTASKSAIELLMFHQFIFDEENKNKDHSMSGLIKYESTSDFKIACKLGITPSRVHNLKLKEQLVYPRENLNWKDYVLKIMEHIKFNESDKTVELTVLHPWMLAQIKDCIEAEHGQVYIQMNKNLLSLPLDSYVVLINAAYGKEGMEKEEIDRLKEYMQKDEGVNWIDVAKKTVEWGKNIKDGYGLVQGLLTILGIPV